MKTVFAGLMHYHPLQKLGVLAILGLAVHLILPQITELEHSWQVLKTLLPWAVGLAFVAQVLSYLGSGYMLQTILDLAKQPVKLIRSTLIVLGAASVGMVAGGMVGNATAIYRWTRQDDGHPEGATLASILPSIFNNLVLVLVSLFGLVHLLILHELSQAQWIGFSSIILILGLVIGMAILALRYRDRATASVVWATSRPGFDQPDFHLPNLDASGAIAGVMGAFLITYPRDRIHTILFPGWFARVTFIPAIILVGFWFLTQLFSEVGALAQVQGGGVGYMAHIGGFIFGAVTCRLFEAVSGFISRG